MFLLPLVVVAFGSAGLFGWNKKRTRESIAESERIKAEIEKINTNCNEQKDQITKIIFIGPQHSGKTSIINSVKVVKEDRYDPFAAQTGYHIIGNTLQYQHYIVPGTKWILTDTIGFLKPNGGEKFDDNLLKDLSTLVKGVATGKGGELIEDPAFAPHIVAVVLNPTQIAAFPNLFVALKKAIRDVPYCVILTRKDEEAERQAMKDAKAALSSLCGCDNIFFVESYCPQKNNLTESLVPSEQYLSILKIIQYFVRTVYNLREQAQLMNRLKGVVNDDEKEFRELKS